MKLSTSTLKRIAVGFAWLLGALVVFLVVGVCGVVPTYFANTVVNDTPYVLHCQEDVGMRDRVLVKPGKRAQTNSSDCGVFTVRNEYVGCIHQWGQYRETIAGSSFDATIPLESCRLLVIPAPK